MVFKNSRGLFPWVFLLILLVPDVPFIKGKHHVFAGTLVGFYVVAGCNGSPDELVHVVEACKEVVVVAKVFKIPVD